MIEFLELYERQSSLSIEIGHNSIADWCIEIHDLRGVGLKDRGEACVSVQECSYELAMAKAYVELCEYLSNTRGGY